jgi:methionyl aminopeptidase
MPIILKSAHELDMMRRAGRVACEILAEMRAVVAPGVTTRQIEKVAIDQLKARGARGLSMNYPTYRPGEGYPSPVCLSVNEEIVHGIASDRVLREGDIITLDLAAMLDGFCCDTATTVPVGRVRPAVQKLLDVTRQTLALAIANMRPGRKWTEVARLMQKHVESHGFNVVREYVGHGVGRNMHEDPKIPNYVTPEQLRNDFTLRPGMTLAIEPMVVMGSVEVEMLDDGWTVVTRDRQPSAHFEHTVAMTATGADILTDGRSPAPVAPAAGKTGDGGERA